MNRSENSRDLNPSFGFWATQLARELSEEFSKKLAEENVKTMDWAILATLYREEGSRPAEISRHACIEPSVVTRVLDRLAKRGLVTRAYREEDRRAVKISLTSEGKKLAKSLFDISMQVNEDFLEPLQAREKKKILNMLSRIVLSWRAAKKKQKLTSRRPHYR